MYLANNNIARYKDFERDVECYSVQIFMMIKIFSSFWNFKAKEEQINNYTSVECLKPT